MEKRTICCKLLTEATIADALKETSKRFSDACNHVLKIAIEEKTHNAIKLHKLCYAEVRELFGLFRKPFCQGNPPRCLLHDKIEREAQTA